jgi:hypothetical protein
LILAKTESKSKTTIELEVRGYDGKKKGHLTLTSGNLYYYRSNAKKLTAQYTYQQLIELIEANLCAE